MPGPWEKYGPARGAPINSGVNPSDVIAAQNSQRGDAQFQYQIQRDAQEDIIRQREEADKARLAQNAQEDAAYNLMRVIGKIDSIKADSQDSWTGVAGLGETGFLGAVQGGIPGTPALGLRNDIKTVDAQQVLQAMTRLKELSPTGSTGFGALSAPELELLRSSVANINADNDQGTFEANLASARKVYRDMLMRLDPSLVERVDQGNYDLPLRGTVTDDSPPRPGDRGFQPPASIPPDIDGIMRKYGVKK